MHKLLLVFTALLTILIQSCGQGTFPDAVNNNKTDNLKRINGTKMFIPEDNLYHSVSKSSIYKKNESTYFSVSEIQNSEFRESNVASARNDPAIKVYKSIKYNGYNGVYIEGVAQEKTMIEIYFGDNSFEAFMKGTCSKSDADSKKEILDIFSHSYYNESLPIDPFELANYRVDNKITGFIFKKVDPEYGFQYAPENDITHDFYFTIQPLPGLPSYEAEKKIIDNELSPSVKVIKKESMINNYHAYIRNFKVGDEEIYEVLLMSGNSGVLFAGHDKGQKYIKQYQETVNSIRLIK